MNWIKRIFKKKAREKNPDAVGQPVFKKGIITGVNHYVPISDRYRQEEPLRNSSDDSSVFDAIVAISVLDSLTPDSSSSYDSSDSSSSSSDFSGFDGGDFGGGGSSSDW